MPKEGTAPLATNAGAAVAAAAKRLVCWCSRGPAPGLTAGGEPMLQEATKELRQAQPNQKQCQQTSRAIPRPPERPLSAHGEDAAWVPPRLLRHGEGGLCLSRNRSSDAWLANAVPGASRCLIWGLVLISGEGLGLFPLLSVPPANWKPSGC